MRIPGFSLAPPPKAISTRFRLACQEFVGTLADSASMWFGALICVFLVPFRVFVDVVVFLKMVIGTAVGIAILTGAAVFLSQRAGCVTKRRVCGAFNVIRISTSFNRTNSVRWRLSLRKLATGIVDGDPALRETLRKRFPHLIV